ncbi:MAG: tRNA (adenosine(37)-N6)-threonylcarbamoyltransferase complex dimerization subunit type 1 TsaB [Lachnospiraceae bacterium]|nr:tRNA (adenosine(37)-N6)-threonylcarbamoyltransferase complex dimerization subunit type 1 TsaB [Lachnospiraceae bacterium]
MKILAIDSSGLVASVALTEDGHLIAEYTIDYKKTHSQTLLPMLDEIKQMIDLDLSTVDAVAVAAGPGSFTGLRIGAATAKGMAGALDKPIVEIPTMDGMAYNLVGYEGIICPIMDARRNQVYTGFYRFEKDTASRSGFSFQVVKEQFAADIQEVIEQLNALEKQVMFLGDGVPVFEKTIREEIKVPYGFAPANCNRQHASALAALAEEYYEQGKMVSADAHKPDYLRLSQAERERLEKENASNS